MVNAYPQVTVVRAHCGCCPYYGNVIFVKGGASRLYLCASCLLRFALIVINWKEPEPGETL